MSQNSHTQTQQAPAEDTVLLAAVHLRLRTAAAIAAPERAEAAPDDPAAAVTALPVARNGWGDGFYIPATSLAGAFRAHLTAAPTVPRLVEALLGSEPGVQGATLESLPSAVRFLGTAVTPPDTTDDSQPEPVPVTELRRRTAIDRRRASASGSTLRTHELLPPNTEIALYLRLDSNDKALHAALLAELATWHPYVGGGRSIGLGRADLAEIRHGTLNLNNPYDLQLWLTLGGPDLIDAVARNTLDPIEDTAHAWLQVPWRIADGVHIGTGETARADNATSDSNASTGRSTRRTKPALLAESGGVPYVPGATWKGILRSRCEFILRSVGLLGTGDSTDLGCDSGTGKTCSCCILCEAFGWSGNPRTQADGNATPDQSTDTSVAARGRLSFTDSPIKDAVKVVRDHVALDRIFGGAADSLLFSHEVVESGTLELTVHKDPLRPLSDPEFIEALLVLACHDINDGYLGIGGGTTRGLGTLTFAHPAPALAGPNGLDREYAMLVLADRHDQGPESLLITTGGAR